VDPLIFALPATLAASCAFMLPVATPPNAIVYGSGYIRIPEMVKAGFVLNIIGIVVLSILALIVAPIVFN
jgi:sodium-dependent dicarboxylate transporter 2/3/5